MRRQEHFMAKARVLKLMTTLGMEQEAKYFKKTYRILLGDNDLEGQPSFIKFVGVDLEKGRNPKLKVYFDPNLSQK
ncbi:MAG: hypothetical protein LUQ65_05875 [Candidatus Helarchaeota archaeon]|nr:hypothetical protein [Candidatus Helarchaeota archaeon]